MSGRIQPLLPLVLLGIAVLALAALTGCQKAELVTVEAVNADRSAFMAEDVSLQGERVSDTGYAQYVTTGLLREFVLEDATGKIHVFYNVVGRKCPPRTGAKVTVTGRITTVQPDSRRVFLAKSISIDEQKKLAKDEVRMCQLNLRESEAYAVGGEEGLLDYWKSVGKEPRKLVYD